MKHQGGFFKNNFQRKMLSFLLGIFFSFIVFELSLRVLGIVDNFDRDKITKASKGQFVILNVGNSYTAGAGAPPGKSYSAQLNELLEKKAPGHFKVINRGRGNVNSTYIRENMASWVKEDNPDLVFVMTGEPNDWNKYGYSNFLAQKHAESFWQSVFDFMRWSKTFRFMELMANERFAVKDEAKKDYSTFFKEVEIKKGNEEKLGYLWLSMFQVAPFEDVHNLTQEQSIEAIRYLSLIEKKLQAPNPLIYSALGYIFLLKENNEKAFIDFNEKSLNAMTWFNYTIYKRYVEAGTKLSKKNNKKYNEIKEKFLKLPRNLPLDQMENWRIHADEIRGDKGRIEEAQYIIKYYTDNTLEYKAAQRLDAIGSFGNKFDVDEIFTLTEKALRMCPISLSLNMYVYLNKVVPMYPAYKERYEKLLDDISIMLNDPHFKDSIKDDELKKEWIISDVEQIIRTAKKSGADVVIQTYPPYKRGNERFADIIIRDWWESNSSTGVGFMDLGLILKEKFYIKNGGAKYYSTEFGVQDEHQSAEGNYEIAKLMEPVVIKYYELSRPKVAR